MKTDNQKSGRVPLRILNEPGTFMGLQVFDVCALGYIFVLSNLILKEFGLELMAFGVLALAAYVLSVIRLNFRRKIIRDSAKHFSNLRTIYAAKTRND